MIPFTTCLRLNRRRQQEEEGRQEVTEVLETGVSVSRQRHGQEEGEGRVSGEERRRRESPGVKPRAGES